MRNRVSIGTMIAAALAIGALCARAAEPAADPAAEGLTFFGWADQHVQPDGNGKHLEGPIAAFNSLPGTRYPEAIGGVVAQPAFVIGCGDITEWPSHAAITTYDKMIKDIKVPVYDTVGNHDEGGQQPVETVKNFVLKRHGALSYTFDQGGVHFVCVYSRYDDKLNNPAQPLTNEAIEFIRKDLSSQPKGTPCVVATHLCYAAMTNRDDVIKAFGDANVIAVLGGHYEVAAVDQYKGISFVQLPGPRGKIRQITAIRITRDRIVAIPYDWEKKEWLTNPKLVLDAKIQGPAAAK